MSIERKTVKIRDLYPNERNPRRITEERFNALRRSIRENPDHLEARPIVARAAPRGEIVAGEMRWRAADAEGLETVPCVYVDLDDQAAALWLVRDNNEYGEWVDLELAEMLYRLDQEGADLELTGFTREETTKLLDLVGAAGDQPHRWPDDPAPDPPENPRSRPGRVYKLGPHRVMCGDSTNPAHVAKLLAGAEPRLIVTDPPYGISLDLGWREAEMLVGDTGKRKARRAPDAGRATYAERPSPGGRPGRTTAAGNTSMPNDDRADWSEAYALVPSVGAIYCWFADVHVGEVVAGIRRVGFEISQFIVWDKMTFALSRAHYHWQHEAAVYAIRANVDTEVPWYGQVADLAIYARKPGSKTPFLGARDQTTIWGAPSPKRPNKSRGPEEEAYDRPTQKPTLLYTTPIRNHLLRGEAFYDPFGGSGTAIIAAEMAGRVAYVMEVSPAFVDVIRERYATFTGQAS